MRRGDKTYLWQRPDWPRWRYDIARLAGLLARVHHAQGHLAGRLGDVGLGLRDQAAVQAFTQEVLKTSEIEGETLRVEAVRSSVARRLGVDVGALAPADRHVDGLVGMVLDAIGHFDRPLTAEQLCAWHAALFPTGYSGLLKVRTGAWRDNASGLMQVVSGALGPRRVLHYEGPPASRLDAEMSAFLLWFNGRQEIDPVVKAGLAHLWFLTVHPFDDGNGRIARVVGDVALAGAEQSAQRFYSLSAQIQRERSDYYAVLERAQAGSLDASDWLEWFLGCLLRAVQGAEQTVSAVLDKAGFWQRWAGTAFNERQIRLINRLLDGFDGKLTSSKWAAIAKCSPDTALRDISDLLQRGVLAKAEAGGRSTHYTLSSEGRPQGRSARLARSPKSGDQER